MKTSNDAVFEILEQARKACAIGEYGKASLLLSSEAKRGDAEALFLLGNIIVDGMGQVLEDQDGVYLLRQSAEKAFLPAVYKLRQLDNSQVNFFWRLDAEQKTTAAKIKQLQEHMLQANKTLPPSSRTVVGKMNPNLRFYRDSIKISQESLDLTTEEQNRLYALAVGGEVTAMLELSRFLLHSPRMDDVNSGLFWLGRAAQKGNVVAQYELGVYYQEGIKFSKDILQACLWFKRAAEKDYVPAIYALAKVYIDKSLGLYNPEEGVALLGKIKQQSPEALILLAKLSSSGEILPRNDKQAKSYLKQAVDVGSEEASLELARLLVEQKNYRDGLPLLTELATQNNIDAIVMLANMYQTGLGVTTLNDKAAFLFYKAACMGSAEAQYRFAKICLSGPAIEDEMRAKVWYRKAASQHHARALYEYGLLLKKAADAALGCTSEERKIAWEKDVSKRDDLMPSYTEAFDCLLEAAEGEEPEAQFLISEMYKEGYGSSINLSQSLLWCKKAALNGNIVAQFQMAELYNHGDILEPNLEQAVEWYRSAASNGSIEASYQLGLMYREGRGTTRNEVLAIKYFHQCSEHNYAPAIRELGWHSLHGVGCEENRSEAELYFLKAAELGDEDAIIDLVNLYREIPEEEERLASALKMLRKMSDEGRPNSTYLLAQCNFNGIGTPVDYEKGLELLEKAANYKNKIAQYDLGMMYFEGKSVPCDYQKAVSYFRSSAVLGYDKSQYMAGLCARDGMGTLVNYSEALSYFKSSAEQGYRMAYLALGKMYQHGQGVISSLAEALHYYRLLAYSDYDDAFLLIADILLKGGNDVSVCPDEAAQWLSYGVMHKHSGCCYRLAKMHLEGGFTGGNSATGIKLMNEAAELGNCDALYYLAQAYTDGVLFPSSESKAIFYCNKAAALNHVRATTLLGRMFLEGRGCESNTTMAFDLFSTAARMGDAEAQYELAMLFRDGKGVQQSCIDAYVWSILALSLGFDSDKALTLRDDVALMLTASQLKEAQYIASERFANLHVENCNPTTGLR